MQESDALYLQDQASVDNIIVISQLTLQVFAGCVGGGNSYSCRVRVGAKLNNLSVYIAHYLIRHA